MSASSAAISASPGTMPLEDPDNDLDMNSSSSVFIGAVKDEWQLFSDRASDYTIGEPIGFGASSIVYAAKWKPVDDPNAKTIPCALKVLDLDSLPPRSLQLLQRETTLMSLSKHPNVLRVRGSWMDGHKLFIALRLMNKGSAADVMRYGWPGGMEEEVVKCILRQSLKGLNYLHVNGFIHRDIKAANLLIDDDGTVLLGDLGVAADLSEDPRYHHSTTSSTSKSFKITATAALAQPRVVASVTAGGSAPRLSDPQTQRPIGKRKSFVGTPCWMAPELIQGKQYDASADIWSFAITALELSQGHPPRFRESPQKVLLRTLQEEPPTLNRQGGTYKYTRAFKDMVDSCLVKDPSKRPTAEQLLQTPFFRSAKKKSYLVNAILKDLPPLVPKAGAQTHSVADVCKLHRFMGLCDYHNLSRHQYVAASSS
ncbi:kinase-like domain-containing protein [Ephemerocybe angulata]|uniref:Kinase-like domain-containing protein n=1 Tax=Ephemerocybe angulata TaxID=980116 RepID=A0A8H6IKE0_9AGAR|nr:kinase-like domain-containing protein [Tulosesus angulatus]